MKRTLLVLLFLGCHRDISFTAGGTFPPAQTPGWARQARFAVTNNRSDTLSFVSATAAPPELLATVTIGDNPVELEGPHHLATSADGNYLYFNLSNYVPGSGSGPHGSHGLGSVPGSVVKLDARTLEKLGETLVDKSPGDIILSADGKLAYVTHYDLLKVTQVLTTGGSEEMAYSTLAIIDTATMTRLSLIPVCVTAHGEGLSADGKTLYTTCALTDQLAVVDVSNPARPQVVGRVPVGPAAARFGTPARYAPYALAVSPADGSVWVSDNNAGDVRVFDPRTMQMDPTRTVVVGGVAMFGAFTRDGGTFVVPHQGDDRLTVIATATLATQPLELPMGACLNAHMLMLTPTQTSGVLVCEGDHVIRPGTVLTLSMQPLAVTGYVSVGLFPDGAAWLPPAP